MSDRTKAFAMVLDAIARKQQGKPAPMATCPRCREPLIFTFRFQGKEFICMGCGRLWGFVEPIPAESTPELEARYRELKAKWDKEPRGTAPGGGGDVSRLQHFDDMREIPTDELLRLARAINRRMCSGDQRWVMTVPVQDDDSDVVIGEVCFRLAAWESTMREIANSGVEFEDERVGYVTVQIDREIWLSLSALRGPSTVGHPEAKPVGEGGVHDLGKGMGDDRDPSGLQRGAPDARV